MNTFSNTLSLTIATACLFATICQGGAPINYRRDAIPTNIWDMPNASIWDTPNTDIWYMPNAIVESASKTNTSTTFFRAIDQNQQTEKNQCRSNSYTLDDLEKILFYPLENFTNLPIAQTTNNNKRSRPQESKTEVKKRQKTEAGCFPLGTENEIFGNYTIIKLPDPTSIKISDTISNKEVIFKNSGAWQKKDIKIKNIVNAGHGYVALICKNAIIINKPNSTQLKIGSFHSNNAHLTGISSKPKTIAVNGPKAECVAVVLFQGGLKIMYKKKKIKRNELPYHAQAITKVQPTAEIDSIKFINKTTLEATVSGQTLSFDTENMPN